MNNNILKHTIALITMIVLASSSTFAQTGTIQWLQLADDAPDKIPGRNGSAPTFEEVGIPVYPGSYLTSVYPVSASSEPDSNETPLPTIILVTSDEQEKVKKFYQERLKESDGWYSSEEYSVFVKGELSDALSRTVPGVAIREETGESYDLSGADPKIKASLKTRIKILYELKK
ncbi:MAG TPA: hypothetical protein VI362_08920 [Ignavibacteriaceae bacterium]|nr:hypothetical protein [Ignavibacteriaceae bacterium]